MAFATAAITIGSLSVGVASAKPVASSSVHKLVLHGTGGLRPAIHLPGKGPKSGPGGIPVEDSGNWSGYVALPKTGKASTFRFVQADFNVPSVNCAVTPTAFNYQWVGFDGWTNGTVEQDGIGGYCVSGSPTYFAWYEMYPAGVQVEFDVNPGDQIGMTAYYNSSAKLYTLSLTDYTQPTLTFTTNQKCASTCNRSSAEVITEGYPSGSYGGVSDFSSVHFDTIWVTDNAGHRGELTDANWNTDEIVAVGASGTDTSPGPLYAASVPSSPALSAYADTWYREN
ncbi:MAG TPA: G1 family glutamic endopeptidase [Streptosporangiaceae bacterium]